MKVIKFGGHAMGEANSPWMKIIAGLWNAGEKFVIVHGGGPQINEELKFRGIASEFVDGLRKTTPEVMSVVETVLTGSVLRSVVRALQQAGIPTVGISGSDGGTLNVEIRAGGKYGLVGDVVSVDVRLLNAVMSSGFLPVVSPVSTDSKGQALNVNADLAAGAIAGALSADQIIYMTDVAGIYRNWPDENSLIEEIDIKELQAMQFSEGMIPKVEAVINAISSGAKSARVIDGRSLQAFEDALAGKGGTCVRK